MSESADAIIFYGYCWSEPCDIFGPQLDYYEPDDSDEKEWEERVAEQRGLVNPWSTMPDFRLERNYREAKPLEDAWTAEHREEIDAWYQTLRDIQKEYLPEVGYHGHYEYSVPMIFIPESKNQASYCQPKNITNLDLHSEIEWDMALESFVEDLEINLDEAEGPGWFLVSEYG